MLGQVDHDGVQAFLGVPYAAPPVGTDRWREALPPPPHPPLEATAFHLPCSQIPLLAGSDSFGTGEKIASTEDCLYLNVWVPPRTTERLPVMVWLHGGQYLRGAASARPWRWRPPRPASRRRSTTAPSTADATARPGVIAAT